MQLLDGLLALGGDPRNTVPLMRITAAEAHLLRAIHGPESVFDVLPIEEVDGISPRAEIERLTEKYVAKNEDGQPIAGVVFAGGPMSVPRTVVDLDLPDTAFRVTSRITAKPVSADAQQVSMFD
jgi:hypothetical protein